MALILLLILAAVPLLGVVWIALYGSLTTVDGLFMSLILLAMSGILGMTALVELRKGKAAFSLNASPVSARSGKGGLVQRGKVQEVVFFESNVGQPNKSIVTLSDHGQSPRMLVLEGDMRNALPVGQRVQIVMRKEGGQNVLADVSYS
ncbi:MAG: hypothetical protein LAO09_05260 [Acidobacteriia bacterium]|nr:hypothetical protein [Terriglobia bacterium]